MSTIKLSVVRSVVRNVFRETEEECVRRVAYRVNGQLRAPSVLARVMGDALRIEAICRKNGKIDQANFYYSIAADVGALLRPKSRRAGGATP